jgi:uncharacterized protein
MTQVLTDWLLTSQRAAVHIPSATAVIADVHLGYGEARRKGGEAVPVRTVADCLKPLRELAVRKVVVAGDLFEDGCNKAILDELLAWVASAAVEFCVVPGNHDRNLSQYRDRLTLCPEGAAVGEWLVVHGHGEASDARTVQGHLHPCLRWGRVAAPCYLVGKRRIVLPAFSADARGVNVFGSVEWTGYRCHAIAGDKVLDFGTADALGARRK